MTTSPFRKDQNPGCQVGGAKNLFTDYALDEKLDPIALVRKARGCCFREAVAFVLDRSIDELLESRAQPGKPTNPKGGSPLDAIEELARLRGWRFEAVRALARRAATLKEAEQILRWAKEYHRLAQEAAAR